MQTVSKSAFKPHAFEYFGMVQTGQTIVITDHGKPVARIVPYADAAADAVGALAGAVKSFHESLEPAVDPAQFVSVTEQDSRFRLLPLSAEIARRSVKLPDIHGDSADRMIIATALEIGCPIVTRDARFAEYAVETVW